MNIKISDNWLRDYLKTNIKPKEIGKLLSYCGASVEYVNKVGKDFVYDIEITSNRPDMMSVVGIAREAAAILKSFNKKAEFLQPKFYSKKTLKNELSLKVEIKDKNIYQRFSAIILDNIKVSVSPKWLKERLEISGIRSLNNVVDISNYIMLETGQPIHIFDYDKIKNQKMILRKAKKGESVITIDKINRILSEGVIIIEDDEKIIDLCGIMGGANSAVSLETKRVIVFVQTYNPLLIRKACQTLGFWTEAAVRFEKNIDIEGVVMALWRVVELLEKMAFGKIKSKLIDIKNVKYKQKKIGVSFSKIDQVIGIKIAPQKIASILNSLGFKIKIEKTKIEVDVPSWRANDINLAEDLIEEIARIYGYHNLPSILPQNKILEQESDQKFFWEKKVKTLLKYLGFSEIYNYSFISAKDLESFNLNKDDCIKIINPLTQEWEYMRPSLVPSTLKTIADNENNFSKMKIFELSNIYQKKGNNLLSTRVFAKQNRSVKKSFSSLPDELLMLIGALVDKNDKNLFFQAKGVLESLFEELGIFNFEFRAEEKNIDIILENNIIGFLEILDKKVIFVLDFEKLIKKANVIKSYKVISKYPLVKMDLAIVVDESILYKNILEIIKIAGKGFVKKIELFDIYRGKQIGPDKKSLAFTIEYGTDDKTLTCEEAKKIQDKIIQELEEKLKAKIRDQFFTC